MSRKTKVDAKRSGRQVAGTDQFGGLATYQALRLMQVHAIRPELAVMLAALAFGGGAHG